MPKRPDQKIKPHTKPTKRRGNPHKEAIKDLLLGEPLTFRNAERHKTVGADKEIVLMAAIRYWQQHPNLPSAAVTTWVHQAFWDIFEEAGG